MRYIVLIFLALSTVPSMAVERPCTEASHRLIQMMFDQAKGSPSEQLMLKALEETSMHDMGEIASDLWTKEQCEFLADAGEPVLRAFASLLVP